MIDDQRQPVRIQFPTDRRPKVVEVMMRPPKVGDILTLHDRDSNTDTEWEVLTMQMAIDLPGATESGATAQVIMVARVTPVDTLKVERDIEMLWRSVDTLDLSVRTANALQNAGIVSLGALAIKTVDELGCLRGMGPKQIREVVAELRKADLDLGMPIAAWYGIDRRAVR